MSDIVLAFSPSASWDAGDGSFVEVIASAHITEGGELVISVELPDERTLELTFPASAVEFPKREAAA